MRLAYANLIRGASVAATDREVVRLALSRLRPEARLRVNRKVRHQILRSCLEVHHEHVGLFVRNRF